MIVSLSGRVEMPGPPVEVADEVELYAREHGRHATLRFVPTRFERGRIAAGTWTVRLTLRDSDKRLSLLKTGQVAEAPDEVVWLHEPDGQGGYTPYNIMQLGAGGVRRFLEKGNTWSGRGKFASFAEQMQQTAAANEAARQQNRDTSRDNARAHARDKRRQWLKIPLVRVLTDLVSPQVDSKE